MLSINQDSTKNNVIAMEKSLSALTLFLANCVTFVTDNTANVRKPQWCS